MTREIYNFISLVVIVAAMAFSLSAIGAENEPAAYSETIDSNKNIISGVDIKKIEKEADVYFYKGIENINNKEKEAYLSEALSRYMLLLKLKPDSVTICTQIGVIHDVLKHNAEAKKYFIRAINLENLNPFANFYFAEYYYNRREYRNALDYYLISYNNGYGHIPEVSLRLATIYEKLGDIEKSKFYYKRALKLNPKIQDLSAKIKSLNKVYYSKSNYKQ